MTRFGVTHEVIDSIPVKFHTLAMALTMTVAISICILSPRLPSTVYPIPMAWSSASETGAATEAKIVQPTEAIPGPMQWPLSGNGLLQFTSAGHVLGFREKEVFMAGGDHALKVEFVGAGAAFPHAQGKPQTLASSQQGGRPLGKVTYPDVWDGVTVVYEESSGAVVKSTYYIAPGTPRAGHYGSPVDQIRLRYNVPVRLDDKGNLVMSFETGEMCESAPVAWQQIEGRRLPVEVTYCLLGEKEVGFRVGKHEPAVPLVIDPKLVWNTFMGSAGEDSGNEIALDISGNIYIVGQSSATWGTPVNAYAGAKDGFVAKLNSAGVRQWHTFMGSVTGDDGCYGIALDENGNVYVSGHSSVTWGVGPLNAHAGGGADDAFAAKLDSSGVLQWHTFMGAAGVTDQGYKIALDKTGNIYVGGFSSASWGTTIINPYVAGRDAFVAKLNSSGAYQWNTFMGAAGDDYVNKITVDSSGNVYVAGVSEASWGTPMNPYTGGSTDGFAAKLNSAGVSQWNTFIGSSGGDSAYGIAVGGSGNVYLTGQAGGSWGTPMNPYVGGNEAFAAKLDNSGVRQWHTFLGSAGGDMGRSISVDSAGRVFVLGSSDAAWGNPVNPHAGGWNTFLAGLSSEGACRWNTFVGFTISGYTYGIAVDNNGYIYVTGTSGATWGAPVNPHAGGYDAFVAKHTASDIKAKMFYFSPVHNLKE